jgi:HD-GYP domain-containing protein (c-di-GMP phosphodiesterase class II)
VSQIKTSLKLYLLGMMAAGAVAMAIALLAAPPVVSVHNAILWTLLVGLSTLTYLAPVKIATKRQVVLYTSLQMIAILTLRPGDAALVLALGVTLGNVYHRRPWFNTAFNATQMALTMVIAGGAYRLIADVSLAEPGHHSIAYVAVVPAGVLLYLVSALAVDVAAAIQRRCSPFANWRAVRGPTLLPQAVLMLVGAATATAVDELPWLMLVAIAPVIAVRSMMHAALEFDANTIRIAEEAADAIDARHPSLVGRSRRMADFARQIAQAHNLTDVEVQRTYLAARLHDVAATLAPDHAAHDTDVHDEHQRAYVRNHAEAGAAYVARTLNLEGVAEAIRYHHERFDGRGHPRGIAGEDIPFEARIVAVAETWVNLTSVNAYRPALSEDQALLVLQAGAGTKWDPSLVETVTRCIQGAPSANAAIEQAASLVAAPRMAVSLRPVGRVVA